MKQVLSDPFSTDDTSQLGSIFWPVYKQITTPKQHVFLQFPSGRL